MKIAIFASIGCGNLGDELILKNEIDILEKKYGKQGQKVEFRVFTYDLKHTFFEKENVEYAEYFPINWKNEKKRNISNYLKFLKIILWSDLIIIGGGGLFYDSEIQKSQKNLEQWVLRTKHFRFFRKKFMFYAVSVDTKNKKNLKKLKQIFKGAFNILVRDEYTRKTLIELGFKVHEIDDPVFHDNALYNPKRKSCIKILDSHKFDLKDLKHLDIQGKRIGIAFRYGYLSSIKNYEVEVAKIWEIVHLLIGSGAKKIVFLPHSFHKADIQVNDYEFLKQFLSPKVDVLDTMQDVYNAYKNNQIDMCFSMRLHSIILSEVYGIPYVAFSYSQKTDSITKKIIQ